MTASHPVMTPSGIHASPIEASDVFAAADEAERRGYDVIDVMDNTVIISD